MERKRIVIIGSGNVATHLAQALDVENDVVQVYSHTLPHAQLLADRLRVAHATDNLARLTTDADYYIISIKDDAVASVSAQMPDVTGIVMHTSGSVDIDVITREGRHCGVFYPLQTFSKNAYVDMAKVPFFIEATDADTYGHIERLAKSISSHIYHADSRQRTVLHIAAVFGCNFVNHLLDISSQILSESGYTLQVLRPLLDVTLDKAMTHGAHVSQTGPAARNDRSIINKHLEALPADKALIYKVLTEHIIEERNNDKSISN